MSTIHGKSAAGSGFFPENSSLSDAPDAVVMETRSVRHT